MGLPPRPKSRPLVRRAVVASILASVGCDAGEKTPAQKRSTEEVAPQTNYVPIPPQVAPPPQVEPLPAPDAPPPRYDVQEPVPPQVAHRPDVQKLPPQVAHSIPPQVAYANGFTLLVLDEANKPLAKVAVKVTLEDGSTVTATTTDRGTAHFQTRVDGSMAVTVSARGYQPVEDFEIDGGMHPFERVVLRKKAR